ncbi:2-nitropropane dioxygenase [Mycobacteroides abscessus subsp. abscessus]|nr:2-nitropropane dioxygenase [Mycobacteroides abscessus subsp. abscessus]
MYGDGEIDGGLWWAGQAQGLIHEIGSCQEVVDRILADAHRIVTETLPRHLAS